MDYYADKKEAWLLMTETPCQSKRREKPKKGCYLVCLDDGFLSDCPIKTPPFTYDHMYWTKYDKKFKKMMTNDYGSTGYQRR